MKTFKLAVITAAIATAVSGSAFALNNSPGNGSQSNSSATAVYTPQGTTGYVAGGGNNNPSLDATTMPARPLNAQDALILEMHEQMKAQQN